MVSGDSLLLATEAVEAISLAGSAMEGGNNAVSLGSGIGGDGHFGDGDSGGVKDVGIEVRRKRRRKRRKGLGFLDDEECKGELYEQRILVGPVKSWWLSSKAEAELCLCLKVIMMRYWLYMIIAHNNTCR